MCKPKRHIRRYRHLTPGRIFHRSEAAGLSFQWCEWVEYLEKNENAGEVAVAEYNGFRWNIFDTCLNPKQVIDWKNKYCSMAISVACSKNGRFSHDVNFTIYLETSLHGASYCASLSKGFASEKEAVVDALTTIERRANQCLCEYTGREDIDDEDITMKYKTAIPYIKGLIKTVEDFKYQFNVRQLELFQ